MARKFKQNFIVRFYAHYSSFRTGFSNFSSSYCTLLFHSRRRMVYAISLDVEMITCKFGTTQDLVLINFNSHLHELIKSFWTSIAFLVLISRTMELSKCGGALTSRMHLSYRVTHNARFDTFLEQSLEEETTFPRKTNRYCS